jgi:uncharacterized membrane-anchored protein YhcB (DUF1043 family)
MLSAEVWLTLILAIIFAGILGFIIGRRKAPGGQDEINSLMQQYEQQLSQKNNELEAYQQLVHEHYDTTADLFKNMAGSYKEMFDHLSTGYEQLGNLSDKRVLPERAGALLDGPDVYENKVNDFMNPNVKGDEDALSR